MIKKCNKKWCLYDRAGTKVLGRHSTEAGAKRQERAISISKARAKGHRIPRKKKK